MCFSRGSAQPYEDNASKEAKRRNDVNVIIDLVWGKRADPNRYAKTFDILYERNDEGIADRLLTPGYCMVMVVRT